MSILVSGWTTPVKTGATATLPKSMFNIIKCYFFLPINGLNLLFGYLKYKSITLITFDESGDYIALFFPKDLDIPKKPCQFS